jgi:hypothetical protein
MQISKYDKINDMTFPRGKISLYQIVKGLAMNNFIKTQDFLNWILISQNTE